MNSIPMSVDGLRERFNHCARVEEEFRKNAATARRLLAEASRDRKEAYRRWQRKVKEVARC